MESEGWEHARWPPRPVDHGQRSRLFYGEPVLLEGEVTNHDVRECHGLNEARNGSGRIRRVASGRSEGDDVAKEKGIVENQLSQAARAGEHHFCKTEQKPEDKEICDRAVGQPV